METSFERFRSTRRWRCGIVGFHGWCHLVSRAGRAFRVEIEVSTTNPEPFNAQADHAVGKEDLPSPDELYHPTDKANTVSR